MDLAAENGHGSSEMVERESHRRMYNACDGVALEPPQPQAPLLVPVLPSSAPPAPPAVPSEAILVTPCAL